MSQKTEKKVVTEQKRLDTERQAFLDDMFNDIYLKRRRVYGVNFFRGIFFGFGTALGGTVLVAFIIWVLSHFIDWPLIDQIVQALQK